MSTNQYVFNQYYFTFVKKIRQCAKKLKDKSSIARDVLKKIKYITVLLTTRQINI